MTADERDKDITAAVTRTRVDMTLDWRHLIVVFTELSTHAGYIDLPSALELQ